MSSTVLRMRTLTVSRVVHLHKPSHRAQSRKSWQVQLVGLKPVQGPKTKRPSKRKAASIDAMIGVKPLASFRAKKHEKGGDLT